MRSTVTRSAQVVDAAASPKVHPNAQTMDALDLHLLALALHPLHPHQNLNAPACASLMLCSDCAQHQLVLFQTPSIAKKELNAVTKKPELVIKLMSDSLLQHDLPPSNGLHHNGNPSSQHAHKVQISPNSY